MARPAIDLRLGGIHLTFRWCVSIAVERSEADLAIHRIRHGVVNHERLLTWTPALRTGSRPISRAGRWEAIKTFYLVEGSTMRS